MKEAGPSNPTLGSAPSIQATQTNTLLNAEDHATKPPSDATRTGFPKHTGQSLSFWLQQVRNDPLLSHRTTPTLPTDADTVIIGSGLTGTLVAQHHLATWPAKSVVVLEAREFCSGATGRNAGHCKPDQWRHYAKFEKAFGHAQAEAIMRNERETWARLVEYVTENSVDCDLWVGETMDVPIDEDVAAAAKEMFERYKTAAGGSVENVKVTQDPDEAVRRSRIRDAKACYAWQASTLQPWKLTAHIMRANLSRGANLQTHTLATRITEAETGGGGGGGGGSPRKWIVHTDRGAISCHTIVHATNAYSAALEPSLRGIITPKPHICTRVVPPRSWSGASALQNSYGVLLAQGGLISINPRCSADGNVLFGGSNAGQQALDAWVDEHPEQCVNDGLADVPGIRVCVEEFTRSNFEGWEDVEVGPGEGVQESWSGVIGLSGDGVPFVGGLPGKEGQWICAGHHGHGMARIFTAAPALVRMMNGEDWEDMGLPDVYRMTAERLERLRKAASERAKIAVV